MHNLAYVIVLPTIRIPLYYINRGVGTKKNYIMLFWTKVGHVGGRLQQSTMENREMKIFGVEYYCPQKMKVKQVQHGG